MANRLSKTKNPVGKRVAAQLKRHPVRFTLRFAILCCFLFVIFQQIALRGHASPILLVGACAYTLLLIFRLLKAEPADQVHEWAMQEKEHLEIKNIKGHNQEELQKLLDYHIKYGNIAEADRISQKLLAIVDKGTFDQESPPEAQPQAEAGKSSGLPSWMQKDTEVPKEESKLPDWM